jgi:plastocyanin
MNAALRSVTRDAARVIVALAIASCVFAFAAPVSARADETVTISGFAFKPASISVKAGTTVVWVNDDSAPHIVADKAGKFRSKTLNKGEKFSQTFAQAGTVNYSCAIHPSMTGTVVVGP